MLDKLLRPRQSRGIDDLLEARIRFGGGDGLADRTAEQEIVLQHDAEAGAEMIDVDLAQIVAVDFDQSLVVAVQHLQETGDRRLARAAASHDSENGALRR